jgi:hypothetical protein
MNVELRRENIRSQQAMRSYECAAGNGDSGGVHPALSIIPSSILVEV